MNINLAPAKSPFRFGIFHISPDDAKRLLIGNLKNRDQRKHRIKNLSSVIRHKGWITTHQGIAISKSGRVLDGQHRLEAIVLSGIGVDVMVCYDIEDDDAYYMAIDAGAERSVADRIQRPKSASQIALFMTRVTRGENGSSADECRRIVDDVIWGPLAGMNAMCKPVKGKNFFTAVATKAAAITATLTRGDDYALKIYKGLVEQSWDGLPPIAMSFIKQHAAGQFDSGKTHHQLARSLKVFLPENANVSVLRLVDSDIELARNMIRGLISK